MNHPHYETELLQSQIKDLQRQGSKKGVAATKFLTPSEIQWMKEHNRPHQDVDVIYLGGTQDFERGRAVFVQRDWGSYEEDDLFAAIQFLHKNNLSFGHRDILGSLMSLGLSRNTIGDILPGESQSYVICLPEMASYITQSITKIGNKGVTVSLVPLHTLPEKKIQMDVMTVNVASFRLDAILAGAFRLSRGKAVAYIQGKKVSLNHLPCEEVAKEVTVNSVFSIQGLGKATLLSVGGQSKKGRIFVEIGRYV